MSRASGVGGVELQVRVVEEPYLRHLQGPDYRRYAGRVGRFSPASLAFRQAPGEV